MQRGYSAKSPCRHTAVTVHLRCMYGACTDEVRCREVLRVELQLIILTVLLYAVEIHVVVVVWRCWGRSWMEQGGVGTFLFVWLHNNMGGLLL